MGRKKNYARDEALDKAMALFWKTGFEGAHLSALVEVTGMNRFSLYKEFGGKEGLFEQALERYLSIAREFYEEHLAVKPFGLDNIYAYFSGIHFDPDYHGCFLINTLTEKHVVSAKAFEKAKAFSRDVEQLFLKNLKAAKTQGRLPHNADSTVLARLLLTFDQGLAVYGIVRPSDRDKNKMVKLMLTRILGDTAYGTV